MPYKDPAVRRLKQAGYSKTYYEKNQKLVIAKTAKNKKVAKEWFMELKATKSCVQCGQSHIATLDFHHTNPAKEDKKLHRLLSEGQSKIRILKEIDKCVVLCSNCHRIHHHNERKIKTKKTCKQTKIE
jgi:hypothetical protein